MAGGKSFLLRWASYIYSIFLYEKYGVRNIPVGLFSEDYPTLKDRQISRIKREFPPHIGQLRETKEEGFAFFIHDDLGGGRILLRNLDDPSKYMSSEFAGIFVEELTRNDEQTFQDLRNRLRYPGISDVKFMGATNPGGVGHAWVRKLFVDHNSDDGEQERFFYVHANVYDNKHVSPTYIKQLESLPEQKRKAYLEGSWDVFEGQYFSEFSTTKHVCRPFIPNKKNIDMIVGGLDWGRTAPFAFYLTAIQKKKDDNGQSYYRAWTFGELYGTEKKPGEWAELILKQLSFYNLTLDDVLWVQCDNQIFSPLNDGSKSLKDQFADVDNRFNYKFKPASKDRIAGWENLHNWLSIAPDGQPYWIISENCKNLIRTLPTLIHDDLKIEDVDSEGEDHAGDAVRYQFKAIKWIDAKVGGVGKTKEKESILPTVLIDNKGREVSIDIGKFSKIV